MPYVFNVFTGKLDFTNPGSSFDPHSPGPIGDVTPSTGAFTTLSSTPGNDATGITITGGSITGAGTSPSLSIAQTWNTTGAPNALRIDITDTASDPLASFANWTLGGGTADQVRFDKNAGLLMRSSLLTDNYIRCQFSGNDAIIFNVTRGGAVTCVSLNAAGNVQAADTGFFSFNGRSLISSPSDGNIALFNSSANAFGLLQFGGTGNTFPSLKRSTTLLQARLADDSAFTSIQCVLRTTANAVAETPSATHTVLIEDASGTSYKVLVVPA